MAWNDGYQDSAKIVSHMKAPATTKQIAYIKSLASDGREISDPLLAERLLDVLGGKDVSRYEASLVIDALLNAKPH